MPTAASYRLESAGLSICQLYCTAMGGQIVVESEEGRGTKFIVTLPAEVRPTIPSSKPPQAAIDRPARVLERSVPPAIVEQQTSSGPGEGNANLILIIDDDASVCELMEATWTRKASGLKPLTVARRACGWPSS